MNFVNLYKYKIGDINNEPQMFEMNVVHWSIASHATEDRLVWYQRILEQHLINNHLNYIRLKVFWYVEMLPFTTYGY